MKFLALVFLLPTLSLALECRPINLLTEPKSPFDQIPVYDQGTTGVCFAYAASQMIDFYAIKLTGKKAAHPAWIAYQHAHTQNKTHLTKGTAREAINTFSQESYCSYESVAQGLTNWSKRYNVSEDKIFELLENYSSITSHNVTHDSCDTTSLAHFFHNHPLIQTLTAPQILFKIISPECVREKRLKLPKAKIIGNRGSHGDVEVLMSSKLNQKKPFIFNYCSNIWRDNDYKGITSYPNRMNLPDDCRNHSSLIVGQKKINRQCHFLVRNTWGSGFGESTQGKKCVCRNKKTRKIIDDCTRETHNNGQFLVEGCWLPSKHLSRSTHSLTVME